MSQRAPSSIDDPRGLAFWLEQRFAEIDRRLADPVDFTYLRQLHVAPTKVFVGMVVLADGTDWNPGSGAGFYGYYGSSWVKLG